MPPFVINSALLAVMAQRLVRRICPECARAHTPDPVLLRRFGLRSTDGFTSGAGCGACGTSGYRGRTGIYELFRLDQDAMVLIDQGATTQELAAYVYPRGGAVAGSFGPMWRDGLEKARKGITTLEEVGLAVSTADLEGDDGEPADMAFPEAA